MSETRIPEPEVDDDMQIGKVPNEMLEALVISQLSHSRSDLIQRSGVGEDCAVVDFGGDVCLARPDPITGAVHDVGRLIVHVANNDIASAGAEPIGITLTILAPPSCTEPEVARVVEQASEAAASFDVQIIGGHTEVTDAVTRMLVSATVPQCSGARPATDVASGTRVWGMPWS